MVASGFRFISMTEAAFDCSVVFTVTTTLRMFRCRFSSDADEDEDGDDDDEWRS